MTKTQRTLPAQERRDPAMNQQAQPAQAQAAPAAAQQQPAQNGGHAPDTEFQRLLAQDPKRTVYIPLGEQDEVTLNLPVIQRYFSNPTRSGAMPSEQDIRKFIMICKQRRLNPWAGDCFLLGYDTKHHGPKFSVIVAQQAILKRAEISPQFDGLESGVVVERGGEIIERPGDLTMDGEKIIGGWAAVYRKDRQKAFYQRLKLQTYQRATQQWDSDSAGMICKCAESAALRQAFPSDVGGLYLEQEIRAGFDPSDDTVAPVAKPQSAAAQLNERLGKPKEPVKEAVVGTSSPTESQVTTGTTEAEASQETPTQEGATGDENQGLEEDEQAEGND